MPYLPDPTDPEDLGLAGTAQSLEQDSWLNTAKTLLRPASRLIESTGNVRDIIGGTVMEGDPLAYFKLSPEAMQNSSWDDIKGALGFGPEQFQKTTTLGHELVNKAFGPPPAPGDSMQMGTAEAVARPIAGFIADTALDPATGLMMGGAKAAGAAAGRLGEMGAADMLLKAGAELTAQYGPDAIGAFQAVRPELEGVVNQYENFHKITHPLFAAGMAPGAVEAGQEAYRGINEQGFTPETAGKITEAGIAGLGLLGAPGDVLNHTRDLYSKYTDPNYIPKNPHAGILAKGFDSLAKKGIVIPEDVMLRTIGQAERLHGEPLPEEQMQELTPPNEPVNRAGVGFDQRHFPVAQAVKITDPDGRVFYDYIDGLNQGHALYRGGVNWDGSKVEPVTTTEAHRGMELDDIRHDVLMKDLQAPGARRLVDEAGPGDELFTKQAAPAGPKPRMGAAALANPDKFGYRVFEELRHRMQEEKRVLEANKMPLAQIEADLVRVESILAAKKGYPQEPPLNTSELEREMEAGLAAFNEPANPVERAQQVAQDRVQMTGAESVPPIKNDAWAQAERQVSIQDAEARLTQRLGWNEADVADMTPEEKLTFVEQHVSPRDIEQALLQKKAGPPQKSRFPEEPKVTSETLSPEAKRQLSSSDDLDFAGHVFDPDAPEAVQNLIDKNGIKLYLDQGELQKLGAGAFHTTYALGKATKGPLAGKEVVLRVGTSRRSAGPIYKGLPEFLGHGGTKQTKGGLVFDLTERTHGKEELGIPEAAAFQHRLQLSVALRKKLPGHVRVTDLIHNAGNARYIEDPNGPVVANGKRYRPVVSDFGVANPISNIARSEAVHEMPSAEAHPIQNHPKTPEQATRMAEAIAKNPPPKPTFTEGLKKTFDALNAVLDKAKKKGLTDITAAREEFEKKGITSFVGRTLDKANMAEELAYMQAMHQAPFEIGSIYGYKEDPTGRTKVGFHRAFTSGKAKSFNASHPTYKAALKEAEAAVASGEIDGYYTAHNHSGDKADASHGDMEAISHWASKAGKGYRGEIITDGDTWTHVPAKKSIAGFEEGRAIPADKANFRAKEFEFSPVEREMLPEVGHTYRPASGGRVGVERVYSPASIASHIKESLTAGKGSILVGITGEGEIRHVMAMPAEELANMKPSELDRLFTSASAKHGVMSWAVASNLDPASTVRAKLGLLLNELKNPEGLYKSPVAGHMNSWNGELTHATSIDVRNLENPTKTLRLLSEAKTPDAMAAARDLANDFILKKLLELGKPAKERAGTETLVKEGELAQKEIGPPDITLKPGQGGEAGLNVKRNLEGKADATVRQQIAEVLGRKDLDRNKPQMTHDELTEAYGKLRSMMSADELHDTMKFISTEQGMLALHEKVNFYWDSLKEAEDAKATYQQMLEAGRGVEDPAAMAKAKDEWIRKDFINQTAMKDFVNAKTTVGRLLSFLKDLKAQDVDPTQTRLGAMMSALREKGVKANVIKALMDTYENNPQEFATAVEKALRPGFFRAFLQLWKAGLISGPPTRLANTGSNAMWRLALDISRNTISPALDVVRSKLSGTERERYFGEAQASVMAYAQQFPLAMQRWMADKGGFTLGDIHTIGDSKVDTRGEGAAQYWLGKVGAKKVADVMDTFFKGLNVDDTFAKHMAAAQAVYRHAYREARKGGISHAEAMQKFIPMAQEIMDGLRNPGGGNYAKHAALIEGPITKALKRETFQDELGQFGKNTEAFLKKHPSLQTIVPFYATPINILKETLRATPFGLFMEGGFVREGGGGQRAVDALLRKEGMKKALSEIHGSDIDELSKMLMGSAITGIVGTLAQYGMVTGGGPNDPRKQAELKQTGWQPYSIKIGDTYYNYQRLEPLSGVLGIAADIFEAVRNGELNLYDEKGRDAIKGFMATTFKNMESKTFLAGFEAAVSAATDPDRNLDRWLRTMEGSLIPNIVGRTAQAIDPQFRDTTHGWTTPLQARIPFLSKTLQGQVTASGEPRMRTGGPLQRFLSPITQTTEKHTPEAALSREMVRVNYLPAIPKSFNTIGGKRIPLTAEEVGWLVDAKAEGAKVARAAIKDPSYYNLPDNEEDPRYRIGMNTKQDVLKRIFQRYRRPIQDRINARVRQRALKAQA